MRYLSDTASILGSTQCPNRWLLSLLHATSTYFHLEGHTTASCLLAPPLPFSTCFPAGCCNASCCAPTAPCSFEAPPTLPLLFASCSLLVCQLVVTSLLLLHHNHTSCLTAGCGVTPAVAPLPPSYPLNVPPLALPRDAPTRLPALPHLVRPNWLLRCFYPRRRL